MPPIFVGPRTPSGIESAFAPALTGDNLAERTLTANVSLDDSDPAGVLYTPDADGWTVDISGRTRAIYLRNESSTYEFTVTGADANTTLPPGLGIQFEYRPSNGLFFY